MLTIVCVENKKLNEKISHTPFIFFMRKTYILENKNKYFCFYNGKNKFLIKKNIVTLMASRIIVLEVEEEEEEW